MTHVCANQSPAINRLYAQEVRLDHRADQTDNIPRLMLIVVKDQELQHRIDALIREKMRCDDNAIISAIEALEAVR